MRHGSYTWSNKLPLILQSRATLLCVCPSLRAAEGNSIIHTNATSESPCGISCYSSICTKTSGQLQPCEIKGPKERMQENKKNTFFVKPVRILVLWFCVMMLQILSFHNVLHDNLYSFGVCTNTLLLIENCHLIISLAVSSSCFRRKRK